MEHGSDVNCPLKDGENLLHIAARHGNPLRPEFKIRFLKLRQSSLFQLFIASEAKQ